MNLFQYNYSPSKKGINKSEAAKRSYFGILWHRLSKIVEVNIIFLFANILQIAFFLFMIMPIFMKTDTKTASEIGGYMALIFSGKRLIPIYIFIPFMLTGPTSAGLCYVCRNIAKQEAIFVWSDFWEATKTNLWQGLLASIIITIVYYVYISASIFYLNSSVNTILVIVITVNLGLIITMTTFYVYPVMITFDVKLKEIFKSSFMLSFLNLPQNIAAFISIITVNLILILNLPIVVWIILTTLFLVGWEAYTVNYIAWSAAEKFLLKK